MATFIKNETIMSLSNFRLLAITGFILGTFVFMNPAFAGKDYPSHQCFKTVARTVYCSKNIVKNHDEGATWISNALKHFSLTNKDILGKPYTSPSLPNGAETY